LQSNKSSESFVWKSRLCSFGMAEIAPEPFVGEIGATVDKSLTELLLALLESPAFSEESPSATTVAPNRPATRAL